MTMNRYADLGESSYKFWKFDLAAKELSKITHKLRCDDKETSRSGGGVGQIWEREGKQCIRC